jgi:hypothetical protein
MGSRERIDELRGHLATEYALINGLIVEACEELCVSQRDVARWAGLSQQRVHQVLADT